MDESIIRDILAQGLPTLGIDQECIPQLIEFSRLLLEKNQVMNLTAITEPGEVATLHLLDSLAVAAAGELAGKKVIDVGTGAGFPGVPPGHCPAECVPDAAGQSGEAGQFSGGNLPGPGTSERNMRPRPGGGVCRRPSGEL